MLEATGWPFTRTCVTRAQERSSEGSPLFVLGLENKGDHFQTWEPLSAQSVPAGEREQLGSFTADLENKVHVQQQL